MSILTLPRHHAKHHPDPSQASIPVAARVLPTGVPAVKLACRVGTGALVVTGLRDEAPITEHGIDENVAAILAAVAAAPFVRHEHAVAMGLAPIRAQLDEFEPPVTDWADVLHGVEAHVLRRLNVLAAAIRTEHLAVSS